MIGRRRVSAKEAPETLVAVDGARCTVDSEKFERTKSGDSVWCMWKGTGAAQDSTRPPWRRGG